MRARRYMVTAVAAAGLLTPLMASLPANAAPPLNAGTTQAANVRVCPAPPQGYAGCDAIVHTTGKANKPPHGGGGTPAGYGPANLQTAYGLTSAANSAPTQTVAIVDAYNDPYVASDLAEYRSYYSLPACARSTGCLTVVNQTGGSKLPRSNTGWAEEISLDVDMVSAVCPNCHILLVEAASNSYTNLFAADDYAAAHARYVSNSWSGGEFAGEGSYDSHFTTGSVFTFATGDNGYGTAYPAASPDVVAVGGTTLSYSASNGVYSETAWSGAGSGCSVYEPQPSWQQTNTNITGTGCTGGRAEADVAAEADPNTGVSVYDSYGEPGWMVFGGTSVATPIIASVYALTGALPTGTGAHSLYSASGGLTDILSGSNGSCGTDLCTASQGWDGPTGLGSPSGTSAF